MIKYLKIRKNELILFAENLTVFLKREINISIVSNRRIK